MRRRIGVMKPKRPMQLTAQTQKSIRVSIPAMITKVRSKEVIICKYYAYVGSKYMNELIEE